MHNANTLHIPRLIEHRNLHTGRSTLPVCRFPNYNIERERTLNDMNAGKPN
jgi:hypothetical protein